MIENPTGLDLPSATNPLLRALFAGYERVVIQAELSGGMSGSFVLLVRPIRSDGFPELPAVVKIAPIGLIEMEWQAYKQHIQHRLLGLAEVRGIPLTVTTENQKEWGGLCYPLLGGGEFDVESLHRYCQHASVEDVLYVLQQRLFPSMETLWRYNVPAPAFHLRRSYDCLLPVNLLLVLVDEDATKQFQTTTFRAESDLTHYPAPGQYVRLKDFVVTEIDPYTADVTLNLPAETGTAYRVRLQSVPHLEHYRVGMRLPIVVGQVITNRPNMLNKLAQQALGDTKQLSRPRLTVTSHQFPWSDLPNPLKAWPNILNEVRDVKVADIHGDFNLENILVDPETRDVRLIDFALARHDHVLHDLLRIETEIVTKLLPHVLIQTGLSTESVIHIYVHLHQIFAPEAASESRSPLPNGLEKPLALLQSIRNLARDYLFKRDDWDEYYQGLTFYLLGALKFKNLDRMPTAPLSKQTAFWAAAVHCAFLEKSAPRRLTNTLVTWNQVSRYFPADYWQPPTPVHLSSDHIEHLRALLRLVLTYLPRQIALDILSQRLVTAGQFLVGTLLFADISGFTALSEVLREKGGEEGAEELVHIINCYLDVMLAILFYYEGQLLRFGGDAMLCLFTGDHQGATDAVQAAWTMKEAMEKEFAEIIALQEVFPLSMKVAGNSGSLFAAHVGNEERVEYILTGSAVERTAHVESAAQKGDVLVSRETYALVQAELGANVRAQVLTEKPDFYRVLQVRSELMDWRANAAQWPTGRQWHEIETLLARADSTDLIRALDTATPYLPTGILSHLIHEPHLMPTLQEAHPMQEPAITGQYRRVTVLFVNFVGMSDIIESRGKTNAASIKSDLEEYFQAMLEEIHYYGGIVNKVDLYDQGDKLIVLFGAPIAREHDVYRAALTALAMQGALHRLTSPMVVTFLRQRIGIHTGYVFAGNVGSEICQRCEYTVMGDTVNQAARLMSRAPDGQIWISQTVFDHLGTDFDAVPLPPVRLKGIQDPVSVYHLRGINRIHWHRRGTGQLRGKFIGRDAERMYLMEMLGDVAAGVGKQIIAITGAAGVGKTRLLTEWRKQVNATTPNERAFLWLSGAGRPYGQQTHGIWIDILSTLIDIEDTDSTTTRWYKLSQYLRKVSNTPAHSDIQMFMETLACLGHFLELDLSQKQNVAEYITHMDASVLQLHTRLALCDLLTSTARRQPVILLLDDLHWADDASLSLLKFVLDQLDDRLPVLFCLCYRPHKEHIIWQTWQDIQREHPDCYELALPELSSTDGCALLHDLLQTTNLPENFETMVLHMTNGNPLYMEEVLHTLIEDGTLVRAEDEWRVTQAITAIQTPDSLYQIIQGRIDELDFGSPGARRVLWLASVIGETFRSDTLLHLFTRSGRTQLALQRHLRELRNAALIMRVHKSGRPGGTGPLGPRRYRFQHGLVRQVAYENMLPSTRRAAHQASGEWIEEVYGNDLAKHSNDLARHFEQARIWDKAFAYHRLAGEQDAQAYANREAAVHFQRALTISEQLSLLGDTLAAVHFALGQVLAILSEFDDALIQFTRADALWAELPETESQRACICYHIGRLYEQRGGEENLATALTWCDRGTRLLPETPTTERARLHLLRAAVASRRADWHTVVQESKLASNLAKTVDDPATIGGAHRMLARVFWGRGELKTALAHCQHSLKINQELKDLVNIAKDYANQGILTEELGDWHSARRAYQGALKLQERIGDQYQLAITVCNLGNLLRRLGEITDGIAHTERGLRIFQALDAIHGVIFARTVLATLFFQQGDLDAARVELLKAQELMTESGAKELEPTVRRWLTEVYLAAGDISQAAAELRPLLAMDTTALDTEAEPVQRLWARLLAAGGRGRDAYRVLQESLTRLEQQQQKYEIACTLEVLGDVAARLAGREAETQAQRDRARALFAELRGD